MFTPDPSESHTPTQNGHAPHQESNRSTAVYDVIGIGFGPGNLGLAIALNEGTGIKAMFLEKQNEFRWHDGMLLPGTTMQISFLKDLVTMRNPESRYTFINYLKEHDRLPDFINRQTFTPERVEFSDYLRWVATNLDADVRYGRTVTALDHAIDDAPNGARFTITAEGPDGPEIHYARTVVVASGLEERLPEWALGAELAGSGRVFHNHRLLDHLAALPEGLPRNALVVGAGQSAAEVIAYLHDAGANVEAAFHGYGFAPADDSPFANRVFDPAAVDDFYHACEDVRRDLVQRHRYTNYACVDESLIVDLYNREYREQVTGEHRLNFHRATRVMHARLAEDGRVEVILRNRIDGTEHTTHVDAVVCATGFRSRGLSGLAPSLIGTETPQVSRDHHVIVNGREVPGLFIQGATESSHGLSATLLSTIAVRAGELCQALRADLQEENPNHVHTEQSVLATR
ncbi:SidA/IucD/PvdA family monooxygenase [Dermatophilus congolensis]|uniref:SidA/IucD/PvdA family monooxygenase n=1 Tax=Dermatophilus congolensis TaxID=1863 RepID=UPI001AAE2915|nr:lysine N(6)-hydroxylase/L-ornithine N(5)-oxygenase family protein [Dermatophilus congolensis]MBO3152512.1 lysine N(6)-hydroxylase/L-ornithine N(5)-oxygenase family protein [Dermatophilus congolensis]MBO3160477.1 lysine N(6)-hydroxylase/L-ornithine N(5)-oxygenase family protein [Dermatophilus congolensis]MBO3163798.1 lysine N(6)-hydroxylase/L-ornithine N(5)-oxygenase family protein [Dermatophilus congolensis]MBO3177344.1 lysine N(6)-hydroxylase/L-ornithine N(5)-oxygenase family protein [Derma